MNMLEWDVAIRHAGNEEGMSQINADHRRASPLDGMTDNTQCRSLRRVTDMI
jgi:hypothetical protein